MCNSLLCRLARPCDLVGVARTATSRKRKANRNPFYFYGDDDEYADTDDSLGPRRKV